MNRLISTITNYSFASLGNLTVQYGYDAASNRTSLTDPQNLVPTAYGYDKLNRLSTMTLNNDPSPDFTFGYDALSRRTSLTRPNGINTSYGYDPQSRLLSVLHKAVGQSLRRFLAAGPAIILGTGTNETKGCPILARSLQRWGQLMEHSKIDRFGVVVRLACVLLLLVGSACRHQEKTLFGGYKLTWMNGCEVRLWRPDRGTTLSAMLSGNVRRYAVREPFITGYADTECLDSSGEPETRTGYFVIDAVRRHHVWPR